jgi:hypothetical protein
MFVRDGLHKQKAMVGRLDHFAWSKAAARADSASFPPQGLTNAFGLEKKETQEHQWFSLNGFFLGDITRMISKNRAWLVDQVQKEVLDIRNHWALCFGGTLGQLQCMDHCAPHHRSLPIGPILNKAGALGWRLGLQSENGDPIATEFSLNSNHLAGSNLITNRDSWKQVQHLASKILWLLQHVLSDPEASTAWPRAGALPGDFFWIRFKMSPFFPKVFFWSTLGNPPKLTLH